MAVKPDIHHRTPDGTRHAGRAEYCHRCSPAPAATPIPVVPATRRGDYVPPVITTELATREELAALTDRGPYRAPPDHVAPLTDPPKGTEVLFQHGPRTWVHGVVETKGYAGTRAAFIHPADLRRARDHGYPPQVRRARPAVFYPADGCA